MPDQSYDSTSVPIPTYEEATASHPSTSSPLLDNRQRQHDTAEHHGLLSGSSRDHRNGRRTNYQPPEVESERSSYDSNFTTPELGSLDDQALRRDMEEMDFVDVDFERRAPQRTRLNLPKTLSNLRSTLSSIHVPFFRPGLPSFGSLFSRIPWLRCNFKIPWPIVARLIGLFIIVSGVYALMMFRILGSGRKIMGNRLLSTQLQLYVQNNIASESIEKYLQEISFDDHIAGTKGSFFAASRIQRYFMEAGLDAVYQDNYEVFLNYPKTHGRRVAIVHPENLQWRATLEEDMLPGSSNKHPSQNFHAHAKSGEATGPLIYANFGSREDFANLKRKGIDLEGSIVLVRYYGTQSDPGLKVKAAEMAGAAGCLIYSDPGQDGVLKGNPYPDGRWRPSDSVQRGSVSLANWIVGDVLTPGEASRRGASRIPVTNNPALPNIPSLPLSWRDAEVLLKALKGHGVEVEEEWKGGSKQLEWWSGNSSSSPKVNLKNILAENDTQPIRNILGKIEGFEERDKVVYVGNHRDASCFGAVHPGSGTAVLLEVVRIFGLLREAGWRPRRTIVFASWDAGEYNLIGSTEYVESIIDNVRENGVAYLNVGTAVSGSRFWANASPVFKMPLLRVLDRVALPQQNMTLRQKWTQEGAEVGGLGSDGDYVAFQDLAGCSSIDFGFRGPDHGFPYQSCYDSFEWMKTVGDPNFDYHNAAAQIWALLVLQMADEDFLAFDIMHYVSSLKTYIRELKDDAASLAATESGDGSSNEKLNRLNVQPLEDAADTFDENARTYSKSKDQLMASIRPQLIETPAQTATRVEFNRRLTNFETDLLDLPSKKEGRQGGIPGRHQFKHIVFGPQAWDGSGDSSFAAIRDAMDRRDWTAAQEQLDIAAKVLKRAAVNLVS